VSVRPEVSPWRAHASNCSIETLRNARALERKQASAASRWRSSADYGMCASDARRIERLLDATQRKYRYRRPRSASAALRPSTYTAASTDSGLPRMTHCSERLFTAVNCNAVDVDVPGSGVSLSSRQGA